MAEDTKLDSKYATPHTSDKDIVIRPLEEGEENDLLTFYREFHQRGEKISNFWEWRLKENSIIGIGTDYVAIFNKKIVGAMGVNPIIHSYDGKRITAYWHRDTLVSPAMRGRGLVKRLLKVASQDWNMVLGKGSNEIMYKVRKSFGWQDVPNSDNMAFVLQPWPKYKGIKTKFSHLALYVWGTVLFHVYSKKHTHCYEIKEFDGDFDRIANDLSANDEFKFFKTSSYLNWRYFQCPGKTYTVLKTKEDKTNGAIVLRLPKDESDEAWIVDCICDPTDIDCMRALLSGAIATIKESKATKILVFCTSSAVRKVLARFGFVSIKRSPKFTYILKSNHVLASGIKDLKWNIWHGDSDNELYE
jgi:hypothetical protein